MLCQMPTSPVSQPWRLQATQPGVDGRFFGRIGTVDQLRYVGRALNNCLANPQPAYLVPLTNRTAEFWYLYEPSGTPVVVLTIEDGLIQEVRGHDNRLPYEYKEDIRSLIVARNLDCRPYRLPQPPSPFANLFHIGVLPGFDLLELGLAGTMARFPDRWDGDFKWGRWDCLVRFEEKQLIVQVCDPVFGWLLLSPEKFDGTGNRAEDYTRVTFDLAMEIGERPLWGLLRLLNANWPQQMRPYVRGIDLRWIWNEGLLRR